MSGTGNISAVIPAPSTPMVDEGGSITTPWRAWFLVLQRRTGGTAGIATGDLTALVAIERAARQAADQALQAAIDAEIAARIAADNVEMAARVAGDQTLNLLIQGNASMIANEIIRATNAEALLVPISQLCTMWSQCDLSFLPTSDPGSGLPWNDAGHIAISTGIAVIGIGLEDDSGTWLPEDGAGTWQWG